MPDWQNCPPAQATPHWPQLATSDSVFAQEFAHSVYPAAQVWQLAPVAPVGQVQKEPLEPKAQEPPFKQGFPTPVHTPAWQVSVSVQALPSSHAAPLVRVGLEQRPVLGSQVPAAWHWSLAAQVTPTQWSTPAQTPAVQTSPAVFGLPSLHTEPFGWTVPLHTLAADPVHWSFTVHVLPSSHGEPRGRTVPLHTPAADAVHWSFCVQVLPSSHADPAFARYTHRPVLGLQPLAVWH